MSSKLGQGLRLGPTIVSPFEALVESADDFIGIADPFGAVVYVNAAGRRLLGLAADFDVRQTTISQYHPESHHEAAFASLDKSANNEHWSGEFAFRHFVTHETIAVSGNVFPLRDDLGEIVAIANISRDLRGSQWSAEALRRSEGRLQRLVDSDVMGVVVATYDGRLLEANDAFLTMLGYDRADLEAGRLNWVKLTPPEYADVDRRAWENVRTSGSCDPFEKEYYRQDGSRVPVQIAAAILPDEVDAATAYVLDLTIQKAAEREVAIRERHYRELADALPQIVMTMTAEGQPDYFNRRWFDVTGRRGTYADWLEGIPLADRQRIDVVRANFREASFEGRAEIRLRDRAGNDRRHQVTLQPMRDELGATVKWLVVMSDVEEQRRHDERASVLAELSRALGQSLDLRRTFRMFLDAIVPTFADWALINLVEDDGRTRTAAVAHADDAHRSSLESLVGTTYVVADAQAGTPAVMRSGQPLFYTKETIAGAMQPVVPAARSMFQEIGYDSLIIVPLIGPDGTICGTLNVIRDRMREAFTIEDVSWCEQIAQRATVAIVNARDFEREHRVADVLQHAALPRALPLSDDYLLSAHYQPGNSEALIGGDWYDALRLDDGVLVLAIGDVAGSGLEAAVTMAKMRQTIRGVALVRADPAVMLSAAHRALRADADERFVTAFVAVYNPRTRVLQYASAGHPSAFLVSGARAVPLTTGGPPLGLLDVQAGVVGVIDVPAGAVLVLYTDGLIESKHDAIQGEAELIAVLERDDVLARDRPASALAEVLLPGGARDDIAILIARF